MPTVLVVSHERPICAMIREILTLEGWTVEQASTAAKAYAYLRASPAPLIVLVYVRLPDANFGDVLHAIAEDPSLQRHRYVEMGYRAIADPDVLEWYEALMRRFDVACLSLPFRVEHLLEIVEAASAKLEEPR
jgi:DNA-binding NtrC family response regulator